MHDNLFAIERRLIDPPDCTFKVLLDPKQTRSDQVLPARSVLESLAEMKKQKRNRSNVRSLSVSPPSDKSQFFRSSRNSNTDRFEAKTINKKHQPKISNKAFNPFRQKDEDEALAKKSHNRRRWSQ
jgi:hypothetical protein